MFCLMKKQGDMKSRMPLRQRPGATVYSQWEILRVNRHAYSCCVRAVVGPLGGRDLNMVRERY